MTWTRQAEMLTWPASFICIQNGFFTTRILKRSKAVFRKDPNMKRARKTKNHQLFRKNPKFIRWIVKLWQRLNLRLSLVSLKLKAWAIRRLKKSFLANAKLPVLKIAGLRFPHPNRKRSCLRKISKIQIFLSYHPKDNELTQPMFINRLLFFLLARNAPRKKK